ncbi:MAG: bifunctional adenosylcobinamide kinase/adenosylcobinamide-phosphate guanylyltransferase, partial [Ilumatobacteraceae bacterium]
MLTLLLGGARSGKSTLAVEIGRRHDGPVTFVATSEPIDGDMSDRIARHRAERPGWPTMEEPLDLAGALTAVDDGNLVIVDCLTLWVGNLLHRGDDDVAVEAQSAETA